MALHDHHIGKTVQRPLSRLATRSSLKALAMPDIAATTFPVSMGITQAACNADDGLKKATRVFRAKQSIVWRPDSIVVIQLPFFSPAISARLPLDEAIIRHHPDFRDKWFEVRMYLV